jgi:hypothetical protein
VCLFAIIAASAGLVTACGRDDESSRGASAGAEQPAPEPSDPPAPGFQDRSGVTNIPAFGVEANSAERSAAQQALSGYLALARGREWQAACGYLAATMKLQLRRLLRKSKEIERKKCGEALRLLVSRPSNGSSLYYGPVQLAALRIKRSGGAGEGAGFALFHGDDGADYWITVRLEAGEWKLTSLAAQKLR